ncbi:hypothetical protein SLA2020_093550 [Shorea laevis]
MLQGVKVREGIGGRRVWKYDNSGEYTVKKAYSLLGSEQRVLEKDFCKVIWNNFLPGRVSFFAWRLFLDRLPTKLNLERRDFQLERGVNSCGKCGEEVEDEGHIMLSCNFAHQVWMKCFSWWGYVAVFPNTVEEAYRQVALGFFDAKMQKVWSFVFNVISWSLWIARKNFIFRATKASVESTFQAIQIRTFLWLKGKAEGFTFCLHE